MVPAGLAIVGFGAVLAFVGLRWFARFRRENPLRRRRPASRPGARDEGARSGRAQCTFAAVPSIGFAPALPAQGIAGRSNGARLPGAGQICRCAR